MPSCNLLFLWITSHPPRLRSYSGSQVIKVCRSALLSLFFGVLVLAPVALSQAAITTHLRNAAQLIAAGKLESAESELRSVLQESPQEHRALDLLGVVRVLQHREADAEMLFRQAIQSRPDFASAHAHLGRLYAQTGRDGEAIPELQMALHLDPNRTDASDTLLQLFRANAKQAESTGDLKQSLGLLI